MDTKTVYLFDIYSNKGIEKTRIETNYKPLWQVIQELEKVYREKNDIVGSIIVCLTDKIEIGGELW